MNIFGKEEPQAIEIRGRALRCLVCTNDGFYQRSAQLHGAVATFFKLEWASPTCTCVICSMCGYVHWFTPEALDERG